MKLYQEIIFLSSWFKGLYVVENVIPYYEPLIKPQRAGRHCFWANFNILNKEIDINIGMMGKGGHRKRNIREGQIPELSFLHEVDLNNISIKDKRQILRNCVNPKLGLHIFNCAFKEKQEVLI